MGRAPIWIGLDVGQTRSSICVMDGEGAVLAQAECETTPAEVEAAMSIFPREDIACISMESGCGAHLCRKLRQRGYNVVLFEARKLKRLLDIRRNKNDRNDARGIADVGRLATDAPSRVHLKSIEFQALRTRLKLRNKIIQHRLAAEGFMRSLLHLHGAKFKIPSRGAVIREAVTPELERLWMTEGIDLFDDIDPLIDLAESLRRHLSNVDAWLKETVRAIPVCDRFLEIPGVGPVCALSFYSAIEEPHRFRKNANVACYFGLTPRLYQSGDVRRMLGITRMGNKMTRSHLYVAAQNLLRTRTRSSALQEWGLALADRVGPGRARIAVARKLSVLMLSMWKSGERFDPAMTSLAIDQAIKQST